MARGFNYYGGYKYHKPKDNANGMKCTTIYKHCNYDMPYSFIWHSPEDTENFMKFVDGLHTRNRLCTQFYEDNDFVSDQIFKDPPADGTAPLITISKERLLNLLRGEERITCRSDMRITLTTNSNSRMFVLKEFVAFMVAEGLFEEEKYASLLAGPDKVQYFNHHNSALAAKGVEALDMHGGINIREELRKPQFFEIPDMVQATPVPSKNGVTVPATPTPSEREVVVKDTLYKKCRDQTTLYTHGSDRRYIRRLIHKGNVILSAWAYSLNAQWNIYHRDAAQLLALGIKE